MRGIPLLVLLAACSSEPASQCESDAGEADRAARYDDPVEILDRYDGPSFSELGDLEVDGDLVWFCTAVQGLQVWDASDPASLAFVASLSPSGGSQSYPRCQHLALADDGRVYVTNRASAIAPQSFIAVAEGSDPAALAELGTFETEDNVEGIDLAGDLLFAAAHEGGLIVYERGPASVLTEIGRLRAGLENPWTVRVRGDDAFVADGNGGLVVVDVSDPAAPTLRGRLDLPGAVKDLELDGDRLYAAAGAAGLALVDVSDPASPRLVELEDTPGSALAVAAGPDAVYLSDWNDVRVFDRRDPDDLVPRGHQPVYQSDGLASRTLGIAAAGDVFFSGNWTELVSYRFHPDADAPDLVAAPLRILLPDPSDGEARAPAVLRNDGSEPLVVEAVDASPSSLSFENLESAFTLQPGDEVHASVLNRSDSTESLFGWLALLSDDPDEPRKCVPVEGNGSGRTIGDRLDDEVRLIGITGDDIRPADLRGGPVLLAYFATW